MLHLFSLGNKVPESGESCEVHGEEKVCEKDVVYRVDYWICNQLYFDSVTKQLRMHLCLIHILLSFYMSIDLLYTNAVCVCNSWRIANNIIIKQASYRSQDTQDLLCNIIRQLLQLRLLMALKYHV